MPDDGIVFANGSKIVAYHKDFNEPVQIYSLQHDGPIFSLMLHPRGLLAGTFEGLTDIGLNAEYPVPGPVTSIFDYKGRTYAFSGWGGGQIFDVGSGVPRSEVHSNTLSKGMRGGPGTFMATAGERLFLANEAIYEVLDSSDTLSGIKFRRVTDYLCDRPKIFSYDGVLYDNSLFNPTDNPKGAEVRRTEDRHLIADFLAFGEKEPPEFIHYVAVSEYGDFWYVTENHKSRILSVYKAEVLMKGEGQIFKEMPEALARIEKDDHDWGTTNPMVVVNRTTLERLVETAKFRSID